jgi:hypothetical protein
MVKKKKNNNSLERFIYSIKKINLPNFPRRKKIIHPLETFINQIKKTTIQKLRIPSAFLKKKFG